MIYLFFRGSVDRISAVVRRAIGFHLLYVCAVRLASQPQYDPLQQERLHFLDMSISAKIQKIPLVTRFLCLATLGVEYSARMYTSLLVGKRE